MTRAGLLLPSLVVLIEACSPAPPRVHTELAGEAVTLGRTAMTFTAPEPMRADNDSVGVCVTPTNGAVRTEEWTLRLPSGANAKLSAQAELADGRTVALVFASSTGDNLCLHPEPDGPLSSAVRVVRLSSSEEVTVGRVTWFSTAP
jgi:hypothetical protein